MSKKVITPVGTSIFSNYMKEPEVSITTDYKNIEEEPVTAWDDWEIERENIRQKVTSWAEGKLKKSQFNVSAEIMSLIKILEAKDIQTDLQVYLLATETIVSRLAADILKVVLDGFTNQSGHTVTIHFDVERDVIAGLQVKNETRFQEIGLVELIKKIEEIASHFKLTKQSFVKLRKKNIPEPILSKLEKLKDQEYEFKEQFLKALQETVQGSQFIQDILTSARIEGRYQQLLFNFTGGYKAVIPYLTITAQINDVPMYYTFEETLFSKRELIEIPLLPVDFDFSIIEENYVAFESLNPKKEQRNLPSPGQFMKHLYGHQKEVEDKFKDLKEKYKLIEEIDENKENKIRLTVLGTLLFNKYQDLFNSGKFHRQNLMSNLIELKLYEFYTQQTKATKVVQGKKIGKKGFDIDVYIEDEETIIAIEVKPGDNIPFDVIEKQLREGGFEYLVHENNQQSFDYLVATGKIPKKVDLRVVLYSSNRDIHPRPKQHIKHLLEELQKHEYEEIRTVKWYWLQVDKHYKTNTHWKVTAEPKPINLED